MKALARALPRYWEKGDELVCSEKEKAGGACVALLRMLLLLLLYIFYLRGGCAFYPERLSFVFETLALSLATKSSPSM